MKTESESKISLMPVSFLFLIKDDYLPSFTVCHDKEGLSVESHRCTLVHKVLGHSLMWLLEAAGALLVKMQKGLCNPQ